MAKKQPKKKGPFYGAKLQCDTCKKVVQSTHVHDFAVCDCWGKDKKNPKGFAIDGGGEYCKMSVCEGTTYTIIDGGNYVFNG